MTKIPMIINKKVNIIDSIPLVTKIILVIDDRQNKTVNINNIIETR